MLAPEKPAETPAPTASGGGGKSPKTGGFFGRARERLRKGLTSERQKAQAGELELEQMRELAALEESVALGLAAFAVQAYLKSVLCPSLSAYTPRATQPHGHVSYFVKLAKPQTAM